MLALVAVATGYTVYPWEDYAPESRPRTRADCLTAEQIKRLPTYKEHEDPNPVDGSNCERPCPYVSCKYHLYLDVNPTSGAVKLNWKGVEVWDMKETCALDVADDGALTLKEVGSKFDLNRERMRQLESKGFGQLISLVRRLVEG